jgi:hypothetical protein
LSSDMPIGTMQARVPGGGGTTVPLLPLTLLFLAFGAEVGWLIRC